MRIDPSGVLRRTGSACTFTPMDTTEATTAKFDHLLSLEDAARRARATAVMNNHPTAGDYAVATTTSDNLNAALMELTVEEIRAYGEYRKAARA